MKKRDVVATDAKAYKDNRSHITLDGREILYGDDWRARCKELAVRCGGICEHVFKGLDGVATSKCARPADDPHHLIPRSKGRDDRLSNLQGLCRYHHRLVDPRQVRWSANEAH